MYQLPANLKLLNVAPIPLKGSATDLLMDEDELIRWEHDWTVEARKLTTRTDRLLHQIWKVVWALDLGILKARLKQCRLCKDGFAIIVGRSTRSKDCEACRRRLTPKQRWARGYRLGLG
jgi:hypothetical protein